MDFGKILSILFLSYLGVVLGANILILEPIPSPSHHIWIQKVSEALAMRGHNVTSISPDVDKDPHPNLHYIHLEKVYPALYNKNKDINFVEMGQQNPWTAMYSMMYDFSYDCCQGIIQSKGFQQLLDYPDDFKFDLVMHDWMAHPCLLGFVHKFKNPPLAGLTGYSGISTTTELIGNTFNSYGPTVLFTNFEPTLWNRAGNFIHFLVERLFHRYYMNPKLFEVVAPYFPGAPPVHEINRVTKLVLMNYNPVIDDAEPILPSIIPVGGLQIKKPKGLPRELKEIADNATSGLILFSLGSNVRSDKLGPKMLTDILETFRAIPQYTFLWKFESDEEKLPVTVPKNVNIRSWIPQAEVLAHPNTILFITHGGLLSSQEASWYGVPLVGIPIFADQYGNIDRLVKKGSAERLFITELNRETFEEKILKVVENSRYRDAAKKISQNFQDQKETPLERAVWWIEWLIRNPDPDFLKPPTFELNVLTRNHADVIALITVVIIGTLVAAVKICCFCRRSRTFGKIKYD